MTSARAKVGHALAKGLGIKLDYRHQYGQEPLSRGESVFSVSSADTYIEEEPTTGEYLRSITPGPKTVLKFFIDIFPFVHWIGRYNWQWFLGDIIAGITVGAVVVPQSMSYAGLANLQPQYGLYSAFMGVLIYWFFATSKDITIGPVAVMSTLVGNIIVAADAAKLHVPNHEIASCLAVIAGAIIFALGFLRLGFIVDFISASAVASFITGAALSIACGQVPGLLGISTSITLADGSSQTVIDTHGSAYLIVIHTLQRLPTATIAASIGMTALFSLYAWRMICNYLARKYPSKAKIFFFISTLRTAIVVLFYTLVSYLRNKDIAGDGNNSDAIWSILGHVPRGFQAAAVPRVDAKIISFFASQLPATVIVLIIEHVAIAKSFGRINNYTINPSQELIAIGVTNLLGPFLGAYPATGSFSRTAIKSKAGVRTPLAGVITAIVVLLAIYALPAVFYWIPSAALSAVIIHAVGDLILAPNSVYQFWRVSPLEVFIFFLGVFVTVFSKIEDGIYTTICVSLAILLFRLAKARGRFLGKVKVHSVIGDHVMEDGDRTKPQLESNEHGTFESKGAKETTRTVFLPLNHMDGSNPDVELQTPYPGIFIYRFSEGFNYPNSNHYLDDMVQFIFKNTRRTNPFSFPTVGDRPWNNPGPRKGKPEEVDYSLPTLKAVILDFSSVNNVDVSVVQNLIDVRNQLDRYASPEHVEWHIASIQNRWTKRALVASGFGYPLQGSVDGDFHRIKPLFSVAEFGGLQNSAAATAEQDFNKRSRQKSDIESGDIRPIDKGTAPGKLALIHGMNRPFFHLDVWAALQAVIQSLETKETYTSEKNVENTTKEVIPSETSSS